MSRRRSRDRRGLSQDGDFGVGAAMSRGAATIGSDGGTTNPTDGRKRYMRLAGVPVAMRASSCSDAEPRSLNAASRTCVRRAARDARGSAAWSRSASGTSSLSWLTIWVSSSASCSCRKAEGVSKRAFLATCEALWSTILVVLVAVSGLIVEFADCFEDCLLGPAVSSAPRHRRLVQRAPSHMLAWLWLETS